MTEPGLDGKQLLQLGQEMFGTSESLTPEQFDYLISMLSPVNYLLKNHKVKGHPMTFSIPDRDMTKLSSHRPWQMDMIRDTVDPNQKAMAVIKSRQLGLSEVGLASLIYFCDFHSYDAIKALYTFPKHMWGFAE